jgi:phenylpropionate dioxygenase-like ring-hydroxylating dioxygenase large terminal subunit
MNAIFNNPNVLSRSWYAVLPSRQLKKNSAKSIDFFDYKIALFRDKKGKANALYAYCPHMGADLGIGKVAGGMLMCPYHKWTFNESGKCTRSSGNARPEDNNVLSFPIIEKFGFIWVFNGEKEEFSFPKLKWSEKDHYVLSFPKNIIGCHPHIVGTNNPDFNHLESLHGLQFLGKPEQIKEVHELHYKYQINYKPKNLLEKMYSWLTGKIYNFHIVQHGSSNIVMDIESTNYQFRTLIALYPTMDGKTISRFFLFIPKGKMGLHLLKLPLLIASIFKIQMQDLSIYNNIKFKLPEHEPTITEHKNFIDSLGTFHPTDMSRSTPSTIKFLP